MKQIGLIGFGSMGSAIAGLIQKNFNILVYDPAVTSASGFKNEIFMSNLEDVALACETIILAVKPDKIGETVAKIVATGKKYKILSIAAGIKYSFIKDIAGNNTLVARLMPNLPLVIGQGVTGYYGDKELYSELREIFSSTGLLIELQNEKLMDGFTALAGSGPAFVATFIQSLAEGGVKTGLPYKDALEIALVTVKGSVELMQSEWKQNNQFHPAILRNKVASPGGTTIYGLAALEKNNFNHAVVEAVVTAAKRSEELGEQ